MSFWDKHATEEEKEILRQPCKGDNCFYNPETGYIEFCELHEAVIADIADRVEKLQ